MMVRGLQTVSLEGSRAALTASVAKATDLGLAVSGAVVDIAGEASIIIVEAVVHIRAIYHLAQTLAPAVVILEDLDLMTKARQNPYAAVSKDDVTGELLQVLSGGSAYADIVTIATTNHPEAIVHSSFLELWFAANPTM